MAEQLRPTLEAAGQGHLLDFYDKGMLNPKQTKTFLQKLNSLDYAQLNALFKTTTEAHNEDKAAAAAAGNGAANGATNGTDLSGLSPPREADVVRPDSMSPDVLQHLEELGMRHIAEGKVAALCLGGGMGTRLGLDGPKGLYSVAGYARVFGGGLSTQC